jgi:hypothetical protein
MIKINDIKNCIYTPGETSIHTTTYFDEFGVEYCHYTDGKTVAEYLKDKPKAVLMPFDQAVDEIRTVEDWRLIKPFKEISENEYEYALEVLPPQKWLDVNGVNIFRMSEYTTGNITAHYASYNGKYYSANRRTSVNYEDIAKEIKSI